MILAIVILVLQYFYMWTISGPCSVYGRSWSIEELSMRQCGLKVLPEKICYYTNLKKIDLEENTLQALPACFHQLQDLEMVFLSSNEFTTVPKILGRLKKLRVLSLENNTVSDFLGEALGPKLKWLSLTKNVILSLPRDLCIRAPKLQKLMLSHNDLETVDLRYCLELEVVHLSGNRLSYEAVEGLPLLQKLSWVALSGNYDSRLPTTRTNDVKYEDLVLETQLRERLSGADWSGKWSGKRVEIKLFNNTNKCRVGMRTRETFCASEGTPRNEVYISNFIASQSENIRKTLAILKPPRLGLVLEAVPDRFEDKPLANSPSFDSITRDVWTTSQGHMDIKMVANILLSVAKALKFLHSKNIAHGDIYAHNIYYSKSGEALIFNFGTSFVYDPRVAPFEWVEVRAFGILMSELIARIHPHQSSRVRRLAELRTKTLLKQVERRMRPSFKEIVIRIERMLESL